MHTGIIKPATIATIAISALTNFGCGGGSATDKAGGSGTPVTLRLATPDRPGMPGAKAIEHFRDEVAEASDGAVRIKPVYEAAGKAPRFDQAVADLVRTRRVELALIPARAWDEYGVTSLTALQAPFLIRDQAVLDEVVTGELAEPMMQGLRRTGVTGLALLPENLRHPFGFAHPLRSPRDFTDVAIRAPQSKSSYALLRALGAKPVDIAGDLGQAVEDRRVTAAESAFELALATLPGVPTATGNVTFFPKVNVLVANSSKFSTLSQSARAALDTAANRTLDWVKRTNKDERDAALGYCGQGGRVVAARAADVERLVALSGPVYTALDRDATTKRFIQRIRALAHRSPAADEAVTCEPARGATADEDATVSETNPSVLDGVYRNRTTVDDYRAVGVPEADARNNSGVHTITLDGGHLKDTLTTASHPNPNDGQCKGTYRLAGDTFVFSWDRHTDCTGGFTAAWRLSKGELTFTDVSTAERLDEVYWGGRPFRKIG